MRITLPRKNVNIVKVIDLVDQGLQAKKPKTHYEVIFTDDDKALAFLKYCAKKYLALKDES